MLHNKKIILNGTSIDTNSIDHCIKNYFNFTIQNHLIWKGIRYKYSNQLFEVFFLKNYIDHLWKNHNVINYQSFKDHLKLYLSVKTQFRQDTWYHIKTNIINHFMWLGHYFKWKDIYFDDYIKFLHQWRRLGRGPGSSKGKTSGRGTKGTKAYSGNKVKATFEGGQTPLYRRIQKHHTLKAKLRKNFFLIDLYIILIFILKSNIIKISEYKDDANRTIDINIWSYLYRIKSSKSFFLKFMSNDTNSMCIGVKSLLNWLLFIFSNSKWRNHTCKFIHSSRKEKIYIDKINDIEWMIKIHCKKYKIVLKLTNILISKGLKMYLVTSTMKDVIVF